MTPKYEERLDRLHRITNGQAQTTSDVRLVFPSTAEDLSDAFNNAIAHGVMQQDSQRDRRTFFARFELIASDVDGDAVIADWFRDVVADEYIRVPRKEDLT